MNPFKRYPPPRTPPSFSGSQLSPAASVANLPALVINGNVGSTILRWLGGQAAAGGWAELGAATTLALQAGTAPTYNKGSPLLGASDDSVWHNGGGYWKDGGTTVGSKDTKDIVVEWIGRVPLTISTADEIVTKITSGTYLGWGYRINAQWGIGIYAKVGATTVNVDSANASVVAGAYYYGSVAINSNEASANGGRSYLQGIASGTGVDCSALGDTDQAVSLLIGAVTGGSFPSNASIDALLIHMRADWLQAGAAGQAEAAAVFASRFAYLSGLIASVAKGVNAPTYARASVAYLNKSGRLWCVGENWVRAEPEGTLISGAAQNICLQSEVLATTWALIGSATRAVNSAAAPNGDVTADTLTAVANADGITQAFASISAVARVYSHYVMRNGAADVPCTLRIVKTSDSSVIASKAFVATAAWQRVEDITGTCVLNDTSIQILITTAGGSLFVWGGQFELGAVSSSYIPTTTAAVTRAADSLYFPATGNVGEGQGAVLIDFYVPRALAITANRFLASVSIGASTADAVSLFVDTSGYVNGSTAITAGDAGAVQVATSVAAAAGSHRALLSWRHNELRLWVDGVAATPDTSCDIPASLTRLNIGSDGALANQGAPIRIVRWKAYDKFLSAYSKAG